MKGRPFLMALGLLGGLGLAAYLVKSKPEPCMKMENKIELAKEFCDGLAQKAAESRCETLSDDPDVMGQCMRVIVPSAHSNCMAYINVFRLEKQYEALCTK